MKVTAEEIRALAERARQADQMALAGVLYAVVGAVVMGSEGMLLEHLDSFCRQQLKLIAAMEGQHLSQEADR